MLAVVGAARVSHRGLTCSRSVLAMNLFSGSKVGHSLCATEQRANLRGVENISVASFGSCEFDSVPVAQSTSCMRTNDRPVHIIQGDMMFRMFGGECCSGCGRPGCTYIVSAQTIAACSRAP